MLFKSYKVQEIPMKASHASVVAETRKGNSIILTIRVAFDLDWFDISTKAR